MRNVLLLILALLLTSCAPGQLFSPTLTPTPTNTPTPTSTSTPQITLTPSPTITLTPTPPALQTLFDKVAAGADITEADVALIPMKSWEEIPAYVAEVNAKPNPFSPDAADVVVTLVSVSAQHRYIINCSTETTNCLVDDAFRLPNNGLVLTFRMKNNDDTVGIFLLYIGGALNDAYKFKSINQVLRYLIDRSSGSPMLPYYEITIYTDGTPSDAYSEQLMNEHAGRLIEDWRTTGIMSPEFQTTIFAGRTHPPEQP